MLIVGDEGRGRYGWGWGWGRCMAGVHPSCPVPRCHSVLGGRGEQYACLVFSLQTRTRPRTAPGMSPSGVRVACSRPTPPPHLHHLHLPPHHRPPPAARHPPLSPSMIFTSSSSSVLSSAASVKSCPSSTLSPRRRPRHVRTVRGSRRPTSRIARSARPR